MATSDAATNDPTGSDPTGSDPAIGSAELAELGRRAGTLLKARGESIAVAEGSAGGLISATLLAVPGASSYYLAGAVCYTFVGIKNLLADAVPAPEGLRGATEPFALYLARSIVARVGSTWGIGEGGAAGPPNRYGDPAGHAWLAVSGPAEATRQVLTGLESRSANMVRFAETALQLLVDVLEAQPAVG
jgi:nicotinamide-nucleotide amidase